MFIKRAVDWFRRSALDFDGKKVVVQRLGTKRRDNVHAVINQNGICFGQIIVHKSG
jgi:hypothetical protein